MSGPNVSNLFPAIAQSFAVIIIGYVFGFFKIIPVDEAKSIGVLVGKLALPALLFQNLAILDLSAISWPFLGGMLIAKFTVFAGVALITVLVSRPFNIGKGGIFGIFVTQSNDFALGLPIVQALYGTTASPGTFNYVSYIYLLAPISLAIINPIGFTFMEFHKQSFRKKLKMNQIPKILLKTVKGVVLNPVIFMTLLGLLVNVILSFGFNKTQSEDKLPSWLVGFLSILGGAYAACALFNIGIFMVGKMKKITINLVLVAMLLIVAKTILLPILAYRVIYTILPHGVYNSTQEDISTFAFLLGTFPTAPTVFVFASQYHIAMELVAASLVLCTFLSAPIMYVVARMVLVTYATDDQYHKIIADVQLDVSILSAISVVCVFTLFILAKRYKSYLHVYIFHIMVAMLLAIVGIEVEGLMTRHHYIYWEYFWFSIFFIGVLSTRIWMASTSIGLLVLLRKGPVIAEKIWPTIMITSWGIPVVITVLLVTICAADQQRLHKAPLVDASFLFGEAQLVISFIVLLASFLIAAICIFLIIMTLRRIRKKEDKMNASALPPENTSCNSVKLKYARPSPPSERNPFAEDNNGNGGNSLDKTEGTIFVSSEHDDIEDNQETSPLIKGRATSRAVSPDEPSDFQFGTFSEGTGLWSRDVSGRNLTRFVILLISLVFSSLVGILIVVWKMLSKEITGIYIAVNVLDTITNFGQGIFIFILFGFEKHWFWTVLYEKLRGLFFKIETVILPSKEELNINICNLCTNFRDKHLQRCKEEILSDKRYFLNTYKSVFTGAELVDWLLENEVAGSREEGTQYGHSLMLGQVVVHVSEEHYFHDNSYFYRFV